MGEIRTMDHNKCNFCERGLDDVDHMIAGEDGTLICDGCIETCWEQIKATKIPPEKAKEDVLDPQQIVTYLDEYVIGQDRAKRTLAVALYNHQKRIWQTAEEPIEKSNILLLGPTGTGKTLLAKTMAKILNVPIIIADATPLTEAGYVGKDVESLISSLYFAAGGDLEKTERGIIYLDEIDKLAKRGIGPQERDVSGAGVQQALLKIMEGSRIDIPITEDRRLPVETVSVDTSNILFICAGAFSGLDAIVKEREKKSASIGFAQIKDEKPVEIGKHVLEEDLLTYGLSPEFLGRLPILATLDALTEENLVEILTKPKNALTRQYKELLRMDGVTLQIADAALEEIAKKALKRKTSARALRSIMEDMLQEAMFAAARERRGTVYRFEKMDRLKKKGPASQAGKERRNPPINQKMRH